MITHERRLLYCLGLFASGGSFAHISRDATTGAWVWLALDIASGLYLLWWSRPLWREPKPSAPQATITVTLNGVPRTYELAREVKARMERGLR